MQHCKLPINYSAIFRIHLIMTTQTYSLTFHLEGENGGSFGRHVKIILLLIVSVAEYNKKKL